MGLCRLENVGHFVSASMCQNQYPINIFMRNDSMQARSGYRKSLPDQTLSSSGKPELFKTIDNTRIKIYDALAIPAT